MKINNLRILLAGIMLIGMVACEYVTIQPEDPIIVVDPVDFTKEIEPIFTQLNCIQCHPTVANPDLTAGKAYTSLMTMNLVDTLNPAGSVLMVKINGGHNSAANMTAAQKALVLRWITEGAKGVIVAVPVSFKNEVEPIFTSLNCTMCHAGSQKPDLRSGKSYASLTSNNFVVAKDPAASKLMQYINAGHQTASGITAAQKALITKWINEGILNN